MGKVDVAHGADGRGVLHVAPFRIIVLQLLAQILQLKNEKDMQNRGHCLFLNATSNANSNRSHNSISVSSDANSKGNYITQGRRFEYQKKIDI